MKTLQKTKILDLLRERDWVCVEEMTKLYIVDYRRRLVDIQRMGYELESKRCELHDYHQGGSKMWRLKTKPPAHIFVPVMVDGVRMMKEVITYA